MHSYSLLFCHMLSFSFIFLHGDKMLYNELDIVKGIMLNRGYISNCFVTNTKKKRGRGITRQKRKNHCLIYFDILSSETGHEVEVEE